MDERIVSPESTEQEEIIEKSLRPQTLAQYIGQDKVKQELSIYIQAAKNREEALDHVLLYGPPGLGKTTMAMVIANEMQVQIKTTSGPAIEKPGVWLRSWMSCSRGCSVYRWDPSLASCRRRNALFGNGRFLCGYHGGARDNGSPSSFPLPPFTLVGATTRAGMLSAPLRIASGSFLICNIMKTMI